MILIIFLASLLPHPHRTGGAGVLGTFNDDFTSRATTSGNGDPRKQIARNLTLTHS